MIKVGLMGYGKAGQAVAQVLCDDPRFDLRWITRRAAAGPAETLPDSAIPIIGLDRVALGEWLDTHPVDALIDFSSSDAVMVYAPGFGGIVGHHEVIFGFPYQTLRIIHNSIEHRAFGTGAASALTELAGCSKGFYTFDDLLMRKMRSQLAQA